MLHTTNVATWGRSLLALLANLAAFAIPNTLDR